MSDIQILTLALTDVVPFFGVMLGVLINNSRLGDVHIRMNEMKELLRAEIRAEGAELREEMGGMRADMRELRSLMERHHSEIMAKLMQMDNRILRLESQRLIQ